MKISSIMLTKVKNKSFFFPDWEDFKLNPLYFLLIFKTSCKTETKVLVPRS